MYQWSLLISCYMKANVWCAPGKLLLLWETMKDNGICFLRYFLIFPHLCHSPFVMSRKSPRMHSSPQGPGRPWLSGGRTWEELPCSSWMAGCSCSSFPSTFWETLEIVWEGGKHVSWSRSYKERVSKASWVGNKREEMKCWIREQCMFVLCNVLLSPKILLLPWIHGLLH